MPLVFVGGKVDYAENTVLMVPSEQHTEELVLNVVEFFCLNHWHDELVHVSDVGLCSAESLDRSSVSI